MKYLILLLLIFNLTLGFTQHKPQPEITKTSTIYILDETWKPRGATHWNTDGEVNYIHIISEEYFVLSSRTRGETEYYEGDIQSWVETASTIHFWVRGRSGRTATLSFDIKFQENSNVEMHMYNTLGKYDTYYSAHIASKEEMQVLLEYYKK
tara:strand:+ start:214 stop:669 length:456 start_codon:yes stop_codon:yes gene_type:complete